MNLNKVFLFVYEYCGISECSKVHFGTASFVLCREVGLFGRFKMHCSYREKIFLDVKLCPCREGVLSAERPLSEIPLYLDVVAGLDCLLPGRVPPLLCC